MGQTRLTGNRAFIEIIKRGMHSKVLVKRRFLQNFHPSSTALKRSRSFGSSCNTVTRGYRTGRDGGGERNQRRGGGGLEMPAPISFGIPTSEALELFPPDLNGMEGFRETLESLIIEYY